MRRLFFGAAGVFATLLVAGCGGGGAGGGRSVAYGEIDYQAILPPLVDARVPSPILLIGDKYNSQAGTTVKLRFTARGGKRPFGNGTLASTTVPGVITSNNAIEAMSPTAKLVNGVTIQCDVVVILESGVMGTGPGPLGFAAPTLTGIAPPLLENVETPFQITGYALGAAGEDVTIRFSGSSLPGSPTPYQGGVQDFAIVQGRVVDSTLIQGVGPITIAPEDFAGQVQVFYVDETSSNVFGPVAWKAPKVTAFSPALHEGFPTAFTITGSGFALDTWTGTPEMSVTVRFSGSSIGGTPYAGGVAASTTVTAKVVSPTQIQGVAPTVLATDHFIGDVQVLYANGASTNVFSPVNWIAPKITAFAPNLPQTAPTAFAITGSDFVPAGTAPGTSVTVRFSGTSIGGTPYSTGTATFADVTGVVVSPTRIEGTSPPVTAAADFTGSVQVRYSGGAVTNTFSPVTWLAPPRITDVQSNPSPVPTGLHTFLAACPTGMKVIGANFKTGATVLVYDQANGTTDPIGSGAVGSPSIDGPGTEITGTAPTDPLLEGVRQAAVRVTNPDGQSATYTSSAFYYTTVGHLPDVNATSRAGGNSGTAVAIDPTDPATIVGAAQSDAVGGYADVVLSVSRDAGRTWTVSTVADGRGTGTRRNPRVAFDRFGALYVSYLFVDATTANVLLLRSTDLGSSFPTVADVRSRSISLLGQSIAEPADNAVLQFYGYGNFLAVGPDAADSTRESVVVGWVESGVLASVGVPDFDVFVSGAPATSSALGSFTAPAAVSDVPVVYPLSYEEPDATIGPDGELYVTWVLYEVAAAVAVPAVILVDEDADGLHAATAGFGTDLGVVTTSHVQYKEPVTAVPSSPADPAALQLLPTSPGVGASPRVIVVRAGPHRGRLVLVYVDESFEDDLVTDADNLDVMSVYSDGRTSGVVSTLAFSSPLRVNDAAVGSQFQPALATDPVHGDVLVSWYTTHLDLASARVRRFATSSFTGGDDWDPSLEVSEAASTCPATDRFGDSQGLAVYDRCAIAVWSDAAFPGVSGATDAVTAIFQDGPR